MNIDRRILNDIMSVSRISVASHDVMNKVMIVAKDGTISATCTDGTLTICNSSDFEGDLCFLVESKRIKSFVANAKGDDIKIDHADGNVTLRSGRARAKFSTIPVSDFPEPKDMSEDACSFEIDGGVLSGHLSHVIHSAGKADVRPFLNGIHFVARGGAFSLQASNGSKGSVIDFDIDSDVEFSVIVPLRSATEIMKIGGGDLSISTDGHSLRLSHQNTSMITKLVSHKYPDINRVFPKTNAEIVMERSRLIAALSCVGVASDMKSDKNSHSYKRIMLEASGCVMRVCSQSNNGDEAEDSIDIDPIDHDFILAMNPDLLSSALASMSGENLTIMHDKSAIDSPIRISDGSPARHVIMPLRR